MNDTPRNTQSEYISAVQRRFYAVLELATFLPSMTPVFWGADVIKRLSNADRGKFERYLTEAKRLSEQISTCRETIQTRMNACIDHVEQIEAGAETPANAQELYLWTYGLFDETLRLSALAMQSIRISEKIAHLLESASDAEKNAAARQRMEAKFAELKKFVSEGFAAAAQDRKEQTREILDKIDQKEKAAARRPTLSQEEAARIILRVKGKDEKNVKSMMRTIQNWERFLRTGGNEGTKPPRGYSRDYTVDRFKFWAEQRRDEILLGKALHNARPLRYSDGATDDV